MTKDNQRADFEAWHTEAFWNPIFDDEEDCFIPRIVQSRYEAYQAGRTALQSQDREDASYKRGYADGQRDADNYIKGCLA